MSEHEKKFAVLRCAVADVGAAIEALPPHTRKEAMRKEVMRKEVMRKVLDEALPTLEHREEFLLGVFVVANAHQLSSAEAWVTEEDEAGERLKEAEAALDRVRAEMHTGDIRRRYGQMAEAGAVMVLLRIEAALNGEAEVL